MDPTLHAKCCGSFWKPRRSHRRVDFCELSCWLDPQGPLSPALFWETRFWRIAKLLPTDKKLHLRPPARPVQHGFNLGASGGAIRGPRHSSLCGDAVTGLVREPFISEADNILDVLATHPKRRRRIQNHLFGKPFSRLHRPIRLDSSRIRR